eukprot:SAG22_NODE_3966_length_1447_cov_2.364985_2_plen_90_part_00
MYTPTCTPTSTSVRGPIEKAPPVRKPRTKKQKEAFAKAQLALAEKRKVDKEKKEASRKPRGRPKKVQEVAEVEHQTAPVPRETSIIRKA